MKKSHSEDRAVLVEKNGPITTIIINRPHRRNAVDPQSKALRRIRLIFVLDY